MSGNDLAAAHGERGAASLSLGRTTEALADADQAVEVDPDAPDMLVCRGEIRIGARQFAAAIDDASRAVVMGAETGRAYSVRGRAKFFLGRNQEAAADFARAATIDLDAHFALNDDLWRAMAYRRMGLPLPDDLLQRAAADQRGAWPRPVLARLADRLPPDELGPLAAQSNGDAATMDGTEADFSSGRVVCRAWRRGQGARGVRGRARARRDQLIEYVSSGVELDKLDGPARAAP